MPIDSLLQIVQRIATLVDGLDELAVESHEFRQATTGRLERLESSNRRSAGTHRQIGSLS